MNTVQLYWVRVQEMRSHIKGPTAFITSQDLPEKGINAGAICEVDAETAARRLAERTHRLATAAEIEQFHRDQAARVHECRVQTEQQKERSVLALTPELAAQIGMLAPAATSPEHLSKSARGHKAEATA